MNWILRGGNACMVGCASRTARSTSMGSSKARPACQEGQGEDEGLSHLKHTPHVPHIPTLWMGQGEDEGFTYTHSMDGPGRGKCLGDALFLAHGGDGALPPAGG